MVILYGLGAHFWSCWYRMPFDEGIVEVIIDNKLFQMERFKGKILSWKEFVKRHAEFHANQIVIGSFTYYDEIRSQIIDSGLFSENQIVFLDDWLQSRSGQRTILQELGQDYFDFAKNRGRDIGEIAQEQLEGALVIGSREAVLARLPQGGIVAEVGVAFGDFSKKIIEALKPELFYAIDMFSEQTKGFWGKNIFEEDALSHYEWYQRRFCADITVGTVRLARGISWEVMAGFPDDYFDYIYLDAAHDYWSVKKDIEVILRKIKNNGIVQFNDYTFQENYGVVPAVNEMLMATGSKMLYYCLQYNGFDDVVIQIRK